MGVGLVEALAKTNQPNIDYTGKSIIQHYCPKMGAHLKFIGFSVGKKYKFVPNL